MKLSFSTLAYPHLNLRAVLERAVEFKVDGVELRVSTDGIHLKPVYPVPREVLELLASLDIKISVVSGYARLGYNNSRQIQESVELARTLIKISHQLGAVGVRLLVDWKRDVSRSGLEKLAKTLEDLADYAENYRVLVLFETHDHLAMPKNLLDFVNTVDSRVGLVYDPANVMMAGGKHEEVFPLISSRIKHVHIKDYNLISGKILYTKPGRGLVPICKIVKDLETAGFNNYISIEWEKLWHPELEDPDVVIPEYLNYIRKCLVSTFCRNMRDIP